MSDMALIPTCYENQGVRERSNNVLSRLQTESDGILAPEIMKQYTEYTLEISGYTYRLLIDDTDIQFS